MQDISFVLVVTETAYLMGKGGDLKNTEDSSCLVFFMLVLLSSFAAKSLNPNPLVLDVYLTLRPSVVKMKDKFEVIL